MTLFVDGFDASMFGNHGRHQSDRIAAEALRLATPAPDQFGAQVEDEFGRLLPTEALDDFRQVAEREQVIGKAEEVWFDGAFIEERQDFVSDNPDGGR